LEEDVLAVRSFFWWGHCFSCTLHLKGIYKEQFQQHIIKTKQLHITGSLLISNGNDEWNHNTGNGYTQLHEVSANEIASMPWIKITALHPFSKWDSSEIFFTETFQLYLKMLNA
jgi:hypothetical protein